MVKLADSCVVIAAAPWVAVADYGAAGGELQRAILEVFRAREIEIPVPQREVRVIPGTACLAERRDAA